MSESASKLGIPVEADAAIIEKELTSLWKSAAETGESRNVMRACACNLISIAQNRAETEALIPVLAKVSEWHPSRSIVAFPQYERTETSGADMRAWISAQCSIPYSGGPQVCCEVIIIGAHPKALLELPNTLSALLIADLPVYVYWKSLKASDRQLLNKINRFSDLLIVDSHQSREDPQNRLQLLQLLVDQPEGVSIRDLNWTRVTPWRDLITQFFDPPAARHHLRDISEVEITRDLSYPGSIPTRTLLLTGWLASRLGWRQISATRSGDQWLSRWQGGEGEIGVSFAGTVSPPGQVPGIHSVILRTRSNAEFSVYVEKGSSCMTAVASAKDFELVHSVPHPEADEASLLINELTHTSEDAVFRAALGNALNLEKSFPMRETP